MEERRAASRAAESSTDQVVAFVRDLIEPGRVRPGDRLPAERDRASQIGESRPSVRAGVHALAAMGVARSRHGSGTYIQDGPPALGSEPLGFLAALHGCTTQDTNEARQILEVGGAALAAERATAEDVAPRADEVAGLFASLDDSHVFLMHDINFRRGIAAASHNPVIASIVEMVSALYHERRRETKQRASDRALRDAAHAHRRVYLAIQARDVEESRRARSEHLMQAYRYRAQEGSTKIPRRRSS